MKPRYSMPIAALVLVAGFGAAFAAGQVSKSGKLAPRPQAAAKRATLDELAASTRGEYQADGTARWMRSFKQPIPWEEYMAALRAEAPGSSTPASVLPGDDVEPGDGGGGGGAGGGVQTTCTAPDADYDGDGFTLTTNPADQFPLRRGEYVADRPRIRAYFTSFIEADIAYRRTGETEIRHEIERVEESSLVVLTTVKETREFKKKFNGSFGLKLALARGEDGGYKPNISLDLGLGGEVERSETYNWTRETTNRVEQSYKELRASKERLEITVGPQDGYVRGQVTLFNLSDYALDADVTNVRVAIVAFSPFTGAKVVFGDVSVTGSFLLGFGSGNNSASAFVELPNINTQAMMDKLADGWIFDMETASFSATDNATGQSLTSRISQVNQRNGRISVHYGDTTARQFGQVSVFQPNNACLTGKDLVTQFVGASNVEFDRLADGTLVVKRINHRTNKFADRDFDTLTPAEQAQYGRWIVGFDYYTQPLTTYDLETTLLAPEDKVFFYFITKDDFATFEPPADVQLAYAVANDATSPGSATVTPVSVGQTLELYVNSDFQIESAYTQAAGSVTPAGCQHLYGATFYGRRVTTDSALHAITVPNADWYGLQVDFGGLGWRTVASLVADADAHATISSFRGFPDYDYKLRFTVTPAMLGAYPTRNLQLRSANARQTFSVGYEGTNINGQHVVCRHNETGGYYHNGGELKVWYKLDDTDADQDGFYAITKSGIDFDDANNRRFPFAPEQLDGLDNDGDGVIDEEPMLCPLALASYEIGTCTLDNRLGWYPPSPSVVLERRFRRTDGTFTAWEGAGNGTSYTFTMPSEPSFSWIEVRATYYPAGGASFQGTTAVYHAPGGEVPVFAAGVDFEAEAGRLVPPMRIDGAGADTFVHVPAGSTGYTGATADYRVNVTQAGTYHIWTRVYATSSADDSFFVGLYDANGQPVNFGFAPEAHFRLENTNPAYGPYGSFAWTRVAHWNAYTSPPEVAIPAPYQLAPGTYTLKLRPRELGTRLDKIRVERYCPDADADGWTTCAGDCNDGNPTVRPNRGEVCSTGYDDDCDGYVNEGCGGSGSMVFRKPATTEP